MCKIDRVIVIDKDDYLGKSTYFVCVLKILFVKVFTRFYILVDDGDACNEEIMCFEDLVCDGVVKIWSSCR